MADLVERLRKRWTREKFERQTRALLPGLYRAAYRLAGQPADAEDLVHDTYVKAFAAYDRADIRGEADCRAWLTRIMVNTYRDRYRRHQRSPEVQRSPEEAEVMSIEGAPLADPAARAEDSQFARAAEEAIDGLPEDLRIVVVLFFSQEMSYREIAEAVDCPVGTVMSRLYRGRRLLRERLQDHAPDGKVASKVDSNTKLKVVR